MQTRRLCKGAATSEAGLVPAGHPAAMQSQPLQGEPISLPQGTDAPSISESLGKERNRQNQKNQTPTLSSEHFWGSAGLCPLFSPSFASLA